MDDYFVVELVVRSSVIQISDEYLKEESMFGLEMQSKF